MNNKTIHSFWISGELSAINLLTILSFMNNGHNFILYCYEHEKIKESFYGFGWPDRLQIKDAREILPESEIFYYKNMAGGNPAFKFGGFAERLKAEMLFRLGGFHVDLDVTCLQPFDFDAEYVLRPHNKGGIVANIIKAPAGCEFARRYTEHTKTITEDNTIWEKSFTGLNQIVKDLSLEKYILPANVLGDDSDLYYKNFTKVDGPFLPGSKNTPQPPLHAIHWCAARQLKYEPGSFYESLLIKYNLV